MDRKEYQKQWREAHREQLREYMKHYQEENQEAIAKQKRDYYLTYRKIFLVRAKKRYEEDPQDAIERATQWNKEHRGAHRKSDQKWTKRNPEKKRAACKRHRESHPEYHKHRLAEWAKRNPLLIKLKCAKRRALIKGSNGTITVEEIKDLYKKQRGKCAACGKKVGMNYHLDHVMPLSLGGGHKIENAQILCRHCNQMKHAMHPDAWAARIGRLFV